MADTKKTSPSPTQTSSEVSAGKQTAKKTVSVSKEPEVKQRIRIRSKTANDGKIAKL